MRSTSLLRRCFAVAVTLSVFVSVAAVLESARLTSDDRNPPNDEVIEGAPLWKSTLSRNRVNTIDEHIPTNWCNDPGLGLKNIKWAVNLGSRAYGGPVIAGGRIYIGTNNGAPRDPAIKGDKGVLMCFRQSDGAFLWQAVHDKLPAGRVNDWPGQGIVSLPVVEGNRLYYVSNRCELVCADVRGDPMTKKAKIIWSLDMIGELHVFPHNLAVCSPLVVGELVFVVTGNGVDEGHINIPYPEAPSFLAVHKRTGKVAWQNNLPTAVLAEARKNAKKVDVEKLKEKGRVVMHSQWSSPVYAEPNGKPQIIFPGGDGWLYAFNPKTGDRIWKFDCNPKDSFYNLGASGTRNDFVCMPVVWENKLYIGTGQDPEHKNGVGHFWCIDITKEPKNKDKDLSPFCDNFDPKAEVNKDSGLVWHYGGFLKPVPAKGRKWKFGRTLSAACVHDGLVYTAELDGIVHCFDATSGKQYWEHDMNADTWASPYWVDGHVYIGNEKGQMLVFEHGKEKKLVNTIDMNCGSVRTAPVVANGVLYVIADDPTQLWAIKEMNGK